MNRASCLCGAVRFRIEGPLDGARFCHCSNCRKFAGTSPAVWAMTRRDAVELQQLAGAISRHDSGRGLRCFCSRCGSPLWFESKDQPDWVAVPLGVLDDGDIPAPEMHIWARSRSPWCVIDDGLPSYTGDPPLGDIEGEQP